MTNTKETNYENKEVNYENKIKHSRELPRFRYKLNLQEHKMLLCFFGQIKQSQQDFVPEQMKIDDVIKYCGITDTNPYRLVRETAKSLVQRTVEYNNGKDYSFVPWFRFIRYRDGVISYQLNDALKTELLQLYQNKKIYVSIDPRIVPRFKNNYGLRIYLILKGDIISHRFTPTYSLDEIYYMLNLPKTYNPKNDNNAAANQRSKIIEPAIKEINKVSDITVSYETVKFCRKVTGIKFSITLKSLSELEDLDVPVLDQPKNKNWHNDEEIKEIINKFIDSGTTETAITKLLNKYSSKEEFIKIYKTVMEDFEREKPKGKIHNDGAWIYSAVADFNPELHKLIKSLRNNTAIDMYGNLSEQLIKEIKQATDWSEIIMLAKKQTEKKPAVLILTMGASLQPDLLKRYQKIYRKYKIKENMEERTNEYVEYDIAYETTKIEHLGIDMIEDPIEPLLFV